MLLIHKKLEYSIIALKYLYGLTSGQLASAKEVSDHYKIPFDTTSRVMQLMKDKNLLRVEHGVRGGYAIACDFTKVTLLDLMEAILGPVEIANCLNREYGDCEHTCQCNIIPSMIALNEKVLNVYRGTTLQDLMDIEHEDAAQKIKDEFIKKSHDATNHVKKEEIGRHP